MIRHEGNFIPSIGFQWLDTMLSGIKQKPKTSLCVAMCLILSLNYAWRTRGTTIIKFDKKLQQRFGLHNKSTMPLLFQLRDSGLISLEINKGKPFIITLLNTPLDNGSIETE
jgi:hypothetical protein